MRILLCAVMWALLGPVLPAPLAREERPALISNRSSVTPDAHRLLQRQARAADRRRYKYVGKPDWLDTDYHHWNRTDEDTGEVIDDGCFDQGDPPRFDAMLSAALDFFAQCNQFEWKLAHKYLDVTSLGGALEDMNVEEMSFIMKQKRCIGLCGWHFESDKSTEVTYYFHCLTMRSNSIQLTFKKSHPSKIVNIDDGCFPLQETLDFHPSCIHIDPNSELVPKYADELAECEKITPTCTELMLIQAITASMVAAAVLGVLIVYKIWQRRQAQIARMSMTQRDKLRDENRRKLLKMMGKSVDEIDDTLDENKEDAKKNLSKATSVLRITGASSDAAKYEAKYHWNVNNIFEAEEGVWFDPERKTPTVPSGGDMRSINQQHRRERRHKRYASKDGGADGSRSLKRSDSKDSTGTGMTRSAGGMTRSRDSSLNGGKDKADQKQMMKEMQRKKKKEARKLNDLKKRRSADSSNPMFNSTDSMTNSHDV